MYHIGYAVVEEARTVVLCRSSYANKAEGAARCAALIEEATGVYVTPGLWPASDAEDVREYAELLCRDLGNDEWGLIEVDAVPGARAKARAERLEHEADLADLNDIEWPDVPEITTASAALALLESLGITAGVNGAGTLWINAPEYWHAPEGLLAEWSPKRGQWWTKVTLDVKPSSRCTRENLERRARLQAA